MTKLNQQLHTLHLFPLRSSEWLNKPIFSIIAQVPVKKLGLVLFILEILLYIDQLRLLRFDFVKLLQPLRQFDFV